MIVLTLQAVNLGIVDVPEPEEDGVVKIMQFSDPQSGIVVNVPLPLAACDAIVTGLGASGKLTIARGMPSGVHLQNGKE